MNGKFGKFIEQKRKARGLTLRGMAAELNIAPAFMSPPPIVFSFELIPLRILSPAESPAAEASGAIAFCIFPLIPCADGTICT